MTTVVQARRLRGSPTLTGRQHVWRVTTAARVFVLAMAIGLGLSNGDLGASVETLLALCVLAAIMSALDFDAMAAITVVPTAEALLVALLVATAHGSASHLVLYLAVPPLVAGLRHGLIGMANTVIAELLVLLVTAVALGELDSSMILMGTYLTWVMVGLGVGLLSVWLRRSARQSEHDLEPYVAAHRLLAQLRDVSRHLPVGLDTQSIADELVREVGTHLGGDHVTLLMRTGSSQSTLTILSGTRTEGLDADPTVISVLESQQPRVVGSQPGGRRQRVAFPVRVDDRVLGVLVAGLTQSRPIRSLRELQRLIDGHSLRLETATLFDEVRSMATIEERSRLAREIHDGVAQEIASLGYLVDDLSASTDTLASRELAANLRQQITRVVGELRLSIFDLRHGVDHTAGLGRALTEYVSEVSARSGLHVHLDVQDSPARLQRNVESELLRVAQEAITNARKHADARNLWVRLGADATGVSLHVEDDGVGSAAERGGHFGLRVMRERAERVGATLTIHERRGGGTVVGARLQSPHNHTEGAKHADYDLAR